MARARLTAFVGLNSTAFRRGLRAMRRRWRTFKTTVVMPMARFGRVVGRTFMRAGLLIGGALIGAVKHASDFRRQMAHVSVMLNATKEEMAAFTEGIIKMSGRFGESKETLAKGFFDILSAEVPVAKAMQFLEVAAKGAVGGFTSVDTAVVGLVRIMNAYGESADNVMQSSDLLFKVVEDGVIEFEDLAQNISKLAPTARTAGVSMSDLAAIIAETVKVEEPARAMTAIRSAMIKAAEGGETLLQLLERFRGKSLEDITKGGINKRAAQGVAILARNFEALVRRMDEFSRAGGETERAFEKMDKVRHWQKLWQTVLGIVTRVGIVLDKALGPAVDFLTRSLNELADTPGFKKFLERVKTVTETITGALIALARGGEGRAMALKGFKLIIIGAFEIAARKAGAFLLKAAPFVGRLIGAGFRQAIEGPIKRFARFTVARETVMKKFLAGDIPAGAVEPGITAEIARIKEEELLQATERISKQFDTILGPAANKLELGFELLKGAAEEATKDLIEFTEATKDGKDEAKKVPDQEAAEMAVRKRPDRGFTEFRRIGGRIMGGADAGGRADVGQRTRLQMFRQQVETNKWLRSLDKRMERILREGRELDEEPAVF